MIVVFGWAIAAPIPPDLDPCVANRDRWIVAVAYRTGPTAADALDDAHHGARVDLEGRFCADGSDFGERRCAAVKRWIQDWKGQILAERRKGAQVCATAALPAEFLDALENDAARMRDGMDQVAHAAGPVLGQDPIHLVAVLPDGTGVGGLGDGVVAELDRRLVAAGIVRRTEPRPGAWELRVTIAPGTDGHQATATLVGREERVALGGFPVPDDLYTESVLDLAAMRTDAALGLVDGRRQGSLDLTLAVPGHGGVVRAGSEVRFEVSADRPARVRLFSVWPDGTTAQLGELDVIEAGKSARLGPFEAVRSGEGPERVVAVGVPAGSGFGRMERWSGYCRLAAPLGPESYPERAAVAAVGVRIDGPPVPLDPIPPCE
ncbi:MAG: hypothetical protein H6735_22945 [Alphaproteobacteria bacterium]|nr:hypothetical protein [Alphaproteobacteria bacterium]